MKVGYDFAMMKIDESVLNKTDMIGCKANSVIKKICMLIDFIFSTKNYFKNIDLNFFNIQGSILLYFILFHGSLGFSADSLYQAHRRPHLILLVCPKAPGFQWVLNYDWNETIY